MTANPNMFTAVTIKIWTLIPKLSLPRPDSVEANETTLIYEESLTQIF